MKTHYLHRFPVRIIWLLIIWLTLGAKCTDVDVTDPNVAATMTELNSTWRTGYQQMLADIGTRHYDMESGAAFTGIRSVLEGMGFQVTLAEGDYYLAVSVQAEQMFTAEEWRQIRRVDEPEMRRIATKHLGVKGRFAELLPDGLLINGTVTLIEADQGGTDISLSFRLRPIKPMPPESILPRREYPPPYAARTGFEKIWRAFEQQVLPIVGMSAQE